MQVKDTEIRTLYISEVKALDPITVSLNNVESGKGKMTIECFGTAWSAYWGSMGNITLEEFFISCETGYLANCLKRGMEHTITDLPAVPKYLQSFILSDRREYSLNKVEAREAYDSIGDLSFGDMDSLVAYAETLDEYSSLGGWRDNLPTAVNPDYSYLCRIINTIKDAIIETKKQGMK